MNENQNRWRSPVAITAVLMLVFFVVKNWIGFEIPMFDEFVTLLIGAGIAVGVFNNPTSKENW